MEPREAFASAGELARGLGDTGYLADASLATVAWLALRLQRPLLLEGEPGTGKTALAEAIAETLDLPLIRLQCYEGIDATQALYDWDFPRQILHLRAIEAVAADQARDVAEVENQLFDQRFLLARPVLRALRTSNRTRELHDALKRRCLYHWIDHPGLQRELEIVRSRAPEVSAALAAQVVSTVQVLRQDHDLIKPPGVAETLDWARALHELGSTSLDLETASATLGVAVKYREDSERVRAALDRILTS